MAHTSTKRWTEIEERVSYYSKTAIEVLNDAEEAYQQFQEIFTYAGGTDQDLANLLFADRNGFDSAGDPNISTAAELALVVDAKNAMIAMHQIFEAANNGTVTQDDRLTKLRRMV